MRDYFHFFKIPFIIIGILALTTLAIVFVKKGDALKAVSSEGNTERTTMERVFDYADKLTDAEEEALRASIREAEEETKCDIVVVTLNESLVEYAAQYEDKIGTVPVSECVMVYADNFYDEHKFGYNEPYGDGVLFLDNWYRESDGYVYSWMSTSGRAEDTYSSAMIDETLDDALYYVEDDPYRAYSTLVELFRKRMSLSETAGYSQFTLLNPYFIIIGALIIALIFMFVNFSSKKGKRTTTDRTYVAGGNPSFRRREDRFLYKNVTRQRIERSSGSSGGGGHHHSSSGRSHGGGGHRR